MSNMILSIVDVINPDITFSKLALAHIHLLNLIKQKNSTVHSGVDRKARVCEPRLTIVSLRELGVIVSSAGIKRCSFNPHFSSMPRDCFIVRPKMNRASIRMQEFK